MTTNAPIVALTLNLNAISQWTLMYHMEIGVIYDEGGSMKCPDCGFEKIKKED